MRNIIQPFAVFLSVFLLVISHNAAQAYSLRQFSSKNGLSNSAILSLCQDQSGFIWIGSCDGLNMFDGLNFQIYKPTNSQNNFSGNLIESILEADDNILWVQTNYGLDRFDSRKHTIRTYKEFKGKNKLFRGPVNDIYIVKEDDYLHCYDPVKEDFYRVYIGGLVFDEIQEMAVDKNNILWIFLRNGNHRSYKINRKNGRVSLIPQGHFRHEEAVLWCFYEDNIFYFIDADYGLYEYDTSTKNKYYIYDISPEILKYGEVSSIIKHHNDYFIGFKSSGLIRLQNTPELKERFSIHEIEIKSGIFSLMKDRYQDIVWVATDGQGVYMYYIDSYTIKTTQFRDIPQKINNPIRSLFLDDYNTLWIGTKGDGIVRINDYDVKTNSGKGSDQLLTSNSLLKNNSVYTIVPSQKNILWIGSENGVNYYSYKDKQIKDIKITVNDKPVKYVHSICELNDSTLWIATVGEGIIKAHLSGNADNPVITDEKSFLFDGGKFSSNYFFTAYKENDSIVWFGNRGYGAYKVNHITEEVETFPFDHDDTNQTLNDVFSIIKNNDGYWFGTSYGLVRMQNEEKQIFNEANGFPNNTVHGILQDHYNNLWLSTNQGIVRFNIKQKALQTYKQQNELEVTEFSDGAYFKDRRTGVLFFGGINGFITISANEFSAEEYNPFIKFNQLSIFGKEGYNIYDFLQSDGDDESLVLKYDQNFFSLSFAAVDYINGRDYTYLYKLDELSSNWIENGTSNKATFTNIPPGEYTLLVKYRNNITGKESDIQPLIIKIQPPWYRTKAAYLVYFILVLLALYAIVRMSIKWYKMKRDNIIERLNQQQQEEIYESKLRFFTNITHEFCTPLTLIYGPCEKILSYSGTDEYINKYASLIQHNAEKLNGLILELIEFRRLETGNKTLDIKSFSVSDAIRNIAESFSEFAETKEFEYQTNITDGIVWNSDQSCLNKIVTNLISNAFKYTNEKGKVEVSLFVNEDKLHIVVSNTGKGIKEENISKIFDRYTILDNIEIQSRSGVSPRNGLGLAVCNSMVKLLDGEIMVASTPNQATTFTVVLPMLEIEGDIEPEMPLIEGLFKSNPEITSPLPDEQILPEFDKSRKTVMIVDDDPSMLWFITEIFVDKYNLIPIGDSKEVMDYLKQDLPDLIISDIMMPDLDGISLTQAIKSDKLLKHIPLILLSAKNDVEEQVRGIDSGAEAYITKPFNVEYLERIVARLIQRKTDLKDYYTSALSAFELNKGQFTHVGDKEFMEKMFQIIEKNASNPDLSVEMLSSALGCSSRKLYRKLKEITPKTPNEMIKEYRLDMVKRLLITTNLSVDEIMYKAGFINRGTFFKVFSQQFNMTPKKYREERRKNMK